MDATLSRAAGTPAGRTALAQAVRAAAPAIVAVTAPAGYGKSTFARALLAGAPSAAICDCRGVTSGLDLARRLVPALADEDPARTASLIQIETSLSGEARAAERLEPVLAAWRLPGRPAIFVLENVEDALASPGSRELLGRLLADRPDHRMVVLCSRSPVRLHLSRFASPHRIVHVLADELAFSADEARAVLSNAGASAQSTERAITVAGGWPIAVLLLARFAQQGRLDALLETLGDVAYDELHDYLAEQIFDTAPEGVVDGLLAATLPRATERDVRLALGDEAAFDAFRTFAKTSPFVTQDANGHYAVHPLVVSMLYDRHAARADALLAAAAMVYEDAGEFQRAAEIQLARGEDDAAAGALERVGVTGDDAPNLDYARVLAALDREVVLQHPQLWSVSALARAYTGDPRALLDEVEGMWSRLSPAAEPAVRTALYVFRVLMLGQLGEFDRALGLIDELRRRIAAPDVPATRMHAWLLALRGFVTAPLGRTRDAEHDLTAASPFVGSVPFMAAGSLITLGAHVARVRGDHASERERLERAIDHATGCGLRNFAALARAEAACGAWLAGDDAAFARHGFALAGDVERDGIRAFAFLAAAIRKQVAQPAAADQAKFVALGQLIAAGNARDDASALRHADSARDSAAVAHEPFVQLLAALAVAELSPARRGALLDEAMVHAGRIDSAPLSEAIAAIARGADGGFLEHFVRRYRRTAQPRSSSGALVVELVTGRVLRDGEPIMLAEREHALLTAIAVRPEPFSRERLTDLLWPDLAEGAARNAFHVCLHRAKARLADDGAIVRTRDGYRLGSEVRVDLWEVEREAGALRNELSEDDAHSTALRALYERLRPSRPPKFDAWEWFEPTERRLRELRCEVAQRLANHELAAGRPGDALALCHEMIAYDPCDEPAREIAIRAYLAFGDRAAALRHFRQYRDVLQAELQCEPSDALAELVGANT